MQDDIILGSESAQHPGIEYGFHPVMANLRSLLIRAIFVLLILGTSWVCTQ
ncbi:MAG: hypothetical protein IPP37_03160 [Saprospiraceae bacterium]|nr:hypothetical protein [Saprospiraceae bacterium]